MWRTNWPCRRVNGNFNDDPPHITILFRTVEGAYPLVRKLVLALPHDSLIMEADLLSLGNRKLLLCEQMITQYASQTAQLSSNSASPITKL